MSAAGLSGPLVVSVTHLLLGRFCLVFLCLNGGIRKLNVNQSHFCTWRPGLVNQHVSYDVLNQVENYL